jgi:GNAT superfamily N-acetyltransferase
MVRIQRDLSRDVIVSIMSNLYELYLSFGRMPNAEVDSRPDLLRVKTGLPHELMNGIFRARFEQDDIKGAIRAALEDFLMERVPVTWWVGPLTQPENLGEHLEDCGLVRTGLMSGMAIDLDAIDISPAVPRELSIERVRDEESLEAWTGPFSTANRMPQAAIQGLFDFFRSVGFAPSTPFRHYVGRWLGQPVATSTLFFGAGVAGVYVSILPEYWKQGIGAAMTLVASRAARAAGYHVGITHVPESRLGFHRKLGFKPYCTVSTYVPRALPRHL